MKVALKGRLPRLQNELGEGGDGGGGFDLEAGVNEISDGLGLGRELDPDNGGDEGDENNEFRTPAPSPAPAPTPTPAPTAAPTPTPAPTAAPAATPAPTPVAGRFTAEAPPTTWTPAMAAKWATIDPEVRAEIARRENDMVRGLEQYRGDAGTMKEVYKAIGPMRELLAQHNVPVQAFVGNLTQAHLILSSPQTTPEQKWEFASKLLKDYGIDLNGKPADADGTYTDPQVKGLQEQIRQLESRLNGADAASANAQRASIASEINTFAEANPLFDEVADDVALIIRGSGGQITLKEAFDRAIWANPVTRAKQIAAEQSAAVEKAQKDAKDRAEAAARAARGRVHTRGHQGSGTAASGSMEDTMAETLRNIKKRS